MIERANSGRLVWLTGASSGLGEAIAKAMLEDGWTVVGTARSAETLSSLGEGWSDLPGTFIALPGDIQDTAGMQACVEKIEAEIGAIDLAILNAGTHKPITLEDFSVETFEQLININLVGTINCLAPLLDTMKARRSGQIAVVGSVAGYTGLPTSAAYGLTKAGIKNMCEALKPECDLHNIQLQLVSPGFVRTPLTDKNEFPMPFLMEPEMAAARMLEGLSTGRFEIVFPRRLAWILKFISMLPYGLKFSITKRFLPDTVKT